VIEASPFVRHTELGLGRLDGSIVRFFTGPATDEVVSPASVGVSEPTVLERQQRVWWHDGVRWLAGFVDSPQDPGGKAYLVVFPNGRCERIGASDLYPRWSKPVADPVSLLQARTVETRFLHSRRATFVADLMRQRNASQGMAGIWSSGIDLHPHQIGAARRVLADPVRRYLLADEVGLGKTIEAGMVIRQILLDTSGDVLVIAPDSLVDQWRRELASKFRVDEFGGRVQLSAHEQAEALEAHHRQLVVVDEAHRLTAPSGDPQVYARLCEITHAASGVLLLSATPVRSNEDGFLRMLHLLDPAAYRLDAVEDFRHRVAIRDELATALAALDEETPLMFLDEPIAALRNLLPHEAWLLAELDALDAAVGRRANDEARLICRRIRIRVAETHRIHRRMIRTRRGSSLAKQFPVRGRTRRTNWLVDDPDQRRAAVLRWVDDVRVELPGVAGIEATSILRTILGRASAPITALADLARALRNESGHDLDVSEIAALRGFAGTPVARTFAFRLEEIVTAGSTQDRFTAMIDWAWPYVGAHQVAVACSFPSTAHTAAHRLEEHFGRDRVIRLLSTMSATDRAEAARRFVNEPARSIIVLDRGGEEGVNLQVVVDVLHLDLPVHVARIEQRLGRFDRWSTNSASPLGPVVSTVFRDSDIALDAHLGAWRTALDEGLGLFDQSSATLQYLMPDAEQTFLADVLDEGLETAGTRMSAQRDGFQNQRKRIEGQDLLDSANEHVEDRRLVDLMLSADQGPTILDAFRGYAVDMLGFVENTDGPGIRFGISKKYPPRVAESDVVGLGPANLRRRYAHQRTMAVHGTGLLRWGEPLVDRLGEFAMRDDRGRAFAIEVQQSKREPGSPPLYFFRFDIVVGPDDEPIAELLASDAAAASAAQVHLIRLFPPRLERVWWSPQQAEPSEQTCAVLDAAGGDNLGSRTERFEYLTREPSWHRQCEHAVHEALRLVAQRASVEQHIDRARHDAQTAREREQIILRSRALAGFDEEADERVFAAVTAAIDNPQMAIDACGVVIISAPEG
jgi:ATP-dependent helicase HepA